ncbi:MAG: hypothetical protein CMP49_04195 [Flavobacteriales bacterium]|jgi:hypothetical protein|nr:hypothetical protein [Flavobacteriales bacterium]|tara:strand:+ start:243 stop:746 length:504 start_codon:yes stop_codon:yes gene_type:complete
MRKLVFFLVVFLLSFVSCDKGCTDSSACNYGIETEDCIYATYEESLLVGNWILTSMQDSYGACIFSISVNQDCELNDTFSSINFIFNDDKTCQVLTTPSSFSDPLPQANWSINLCQNKLVFTTPASGYDNYIYPNYSPFGSQEIISLTNDIFISEDLAGNILSWQKI